jgi:hypothetical protein
MGKVAAVFFAGALLLAGRAPAGAGIVTVLYEAEAVTVVDEPFGIEVPRLTVVTGYFTFDTSTPDNDPADEYDGEYSHDGNAGYLASFLGHEVRGSQTPFYWVDLVMNSPQSDTFRIYDGPRAVGFEGGTMSFDGTPDEDIELFLAVSEDVFDDDDLINPFPFYDFESFIHTPHTFTLEDDQGTILLQFLHVSEAVCGDVNSGGVKAADALEVLRASVGSRSCLPCVCDVDGNGDIVSSDALKTLRYAVNPTSALDCSPCV